jgi:uncharacterized SAM-binding protein YcdF (DUF218 family)
MFFIASKVLWFLLGPTHALFIAGMTSLALARRFKTAWIVSLVAFGFILALGLLPAGALLVRPLEDRFPLPADVAAPTGIIVLGGGIDDAIGRARGQVTFGFAGAQRLTESAILALRFPNARLIYTGGDNSLTDVITTEAKDARRLWVSLGIAPARIELEDKSRNTDENARFTAALLQPQPAETWLLVTSAFHMPRSMGLFRRAGFNVIAWPVNYLTQGNGEDWKPNHDLVAGLSMFELASHEWTGLVAYWATHKIDSPFPAP